MRTYNDGTNFVIDTDGGYLYTTNNVSATGYSTRTQVNTNENALESAILGEDLLNNDGSINHSAYGDCYNPVNVTDMDRPEYIITNPEVELPNGTMVIGFKNETVYPHKKLQDEVDLVCMMAQEMQISALFNKNIDLYDGLTDFNEGIMAESIFTQSKTIEDGEK